MDKIEQKAQAKVNEVAKERGIRGFCVSIKRNKSLIEEALCRAIEQHEEDKAAHVERLLAMDALTTTAETQREAAKQELADFKQEVSNIVHHYVYADGGPDDWEKLIALIIPAPKPDPLVQAMEEMDICAYAEIKAEYADSLRSDLVGRFRAALDKLGFEIREKKDDAGN